MMKSAQLLGVTLSSILGALVPLLQGCSAPIPDSSLPNSTELGNPRGYRIVRTITHLHSPYSYDACDGNGFPNGVINAACLKDLRRALCVNRIDFTFLTDHPANMGNYSMQELLLDGAAPSRDELLTNAGAPYANRLGDCENAFAPTLLVGFEGTEMALGMTHHLETAPSDRLDWYARDSVELRNRLSTEVDALVVIPHTEGKTLEWIRSLTPDSLEIYNFHANLDPKIRERDLKIPPFKILPSLISYLIDPFHELVPDYAFLSFLEMNPIYFYKWNTLISEGMKITALGGTDSHQNVLPQIVSDGERMDSHRRLVRMMSNHFLVHSADSGEVKTAIKEGRGWLVFEGLGTPVGMDFLATTGATTIGVGETGAIQNSSATLSVKLPSLHTRSPHGDDSPIIRIRLKRVTSSGQDETVATSENAELQFTTAKEGAYRAEIAIVPKHLKKFLGDFDYQANREFPWITTNHLFLTL